MKTLSELEAPVIERIFGPRDTKSSWQWIDEHCFLTVSSGAKVTGPIDTGLTPYFRHILEAYDDPGVREITIVKSAQVGASTIMCCLICFDVERHPGPQLVVTSTGDVSNEFSDRSLEPQIKLCAPVNALALREKGHWTKGEKEFKNGAKVGLIGSNSPARLAGRPVSRLKLDEIDKYPSAGDKEAAAIDLAEARTLTYEDQRKIIAASTPTTDRGPIWQRFLRGTQEYFEVPCPECGTWQVLEFNYSKEGGGIWWPGIEGTSESGDCRREDGSWDLDRVQKETVYVCKGCKAGWEEADKPEIVAKCRPVITNPNAPTSHRSFHISSLYAPLQTWGGIAKKYLSAKDEPGGLHDFYNNYLGKPWSGSITTLKISNIHKIRDASPKYSRGDLPAAPKFIFMTVDVQQYCYFWVVRAWCYKKVSYLLDYGPAVSPEDLWKVFNQVYMLGGRQFKAWRALMDSGQWAKRTNGVYEICIKSRGCFIPSKGSSKEQGLKSPVSKTLIEYEGRKFWLYHYDNAIFKEMLYEKTIRDGEGPGWFLPKDIDQDYCAQLTAEQKVEKKLAGGGIELEWKKVRNNHLGDCEKMQMVFSAMGDVSRTLSTEKSEDDNQEPVETTNPYGTGVEPWPANPDVPINIPY